MSMRISKTGPYNSNTQRVDSDLPIKKNILKKQQILVPNQKRFLIFVIWNTHSTNFYKK
jgi:hypothetical protein